MYARNSFYIGSTGAPVHTCVQSVTQRSLWARAWVWFVIQNPVVLVLQTHMSPCSLEGLGSSTTHEPAPLLSSSLPLPLRFLLHHHYLSGWQKVLTRYFAWYGDCKLFNEKRAGGELGLIRVYAWSIPKLRTHFEKCSNSTHPDK